jgi:hypothetical protein
VTTGIFWLASYPKSGNTWLRSFLTNYLRNNSAPADINELEITPIASARPIFDDFCGVDSGDLTLEEIDHLRPKAYIRWAQSLSYSLNSNGLILSKVHDAYTYLDNGAPLFPLEATRGIIYIIRNPLDVAVSFANHSSSSIDQSIQQLNSKHMAFCKTVKDQPNQLRQKLLSWSEHVISWNSVSNIPRLLVRYEDMACNPMITFSAVIKFVGESLDSELLERAIEFSSFNTLKQQESKEGFREKPYRMESFFRQGKVGSWREVLTHEQAARLVHNHADVMLQYGYLEPNGKLVY